MSLPVTPTHLDGLTSTVRYIGLPTGGRGENVMNSNKAALSRLVAVCTILATIIVVLEFVGVAHLQDMLPHQSIGSPSVITLPSAPAEPTAYSYETVAPGPYCTSGGAVWSIVNATSLCSNTNATLTVSTPTGLGLLVFRGAVHLPNNYSISVGITGLRIGVCAGVLTRMSDRHAGGYAFLVCEDGRWLIDKFGLDNQPQLLAHGQVARQSDYMVVAVSNNVEQQLSLNGTELKTVLDNTLTTTDTVSLFVDPVSSGKSMATFHDFLFAQLP